MPLPAEIIRAKRLGQALGDAQIEAFVRGLTDRSWSEGQIAALAMAICLNGMDRAETVALTRAMTRSGTVLDWSRDGLPGPVVDKHSTGGIGDKVSLLLAPIVAACGGVLPMVSGRGLGHTGGTLDKLEALPGYTVAPPRHRLRRVLREAGCAIVGASTRLAPADRRLYAIRDVTATVESVALITASILSKKLAAGVRALVMDVKVGNGAFCPTLPEAHALARSLVEVARGAGLPTRALVTDMNQCLGTTAGNALEVQECLAALAGAPAEPRLREVTLALAAQLLHLAGLAASVEDGRRNADAAWRSGAAAERFARMVAGLGGPRDVFAWVPPAAPALRPLPAPRDGVLAAMDTRALGLAIVALGGGRVRPGDTIDPRVGLSQLRPLGSPVRAGEPLLQVHAADVASAEAACRALADALRIDDMAAPAAPVIHATLE
ncbi:thymidine phosphorylase [Piscinibacter defluvii]|uniref:thymidine phosphorylase n=1 Tax=Piscinibacter defluvii TaxID=1796922 RepID=UPI000FDDF471|nr:thymidine phosphorylase [Piscinibacter defluvii]